jgi:O-antigen/teichoic acid export membrane protein
MIDSLRLWVTHARASVLPPGSLGARLARGAFWSLIGTIISQGLGLVSSVIVARLLGKVGFGELGMINSTVGMLGVFAGLGLDLTATKHVAELRVKDPDRASKILGLSQLVSVFSGGTVSLVLLAFAPLLAAQTLNAPHLVNELRLGCGLLFLNALNGAQTGALAGFEAFKTIAQINLVRGLLNFPVMIAGVWLFGLPGVIGAMVVVAAVGWWINQRALQQECRRAGVIVTYRGVKTEWSVLWRFSVPAFLSGAMVGPATWVASTILVNQPNGYAEMGVFNAANQWRTALFFLPGIFGSVNLPVLSSLLGFRDVAASRKVLINTIIGSAIVTLPVAALLVFFSGHIMAFYGTKFIDRGEVLSITALTIALLAVQTPVGQVITAAGRMWLGMVMNLGWALVLLMGTWLLLRQGWGATGLALAYLIAYTVHGVWTFGFALRFVRTIPSPIRTNREPV